MWLQAEYLPVSLFTLKLSLATSSGARSLVVPTPFSIKTALVDALLRTDPEASAADLTRTLAGCTVALRPCRRATITNLFARVLKPRREDGGGSAGASTDTAEGGEGRPRAGRGLRDGADGAAASSEGEAQAGSEAGPFGRTIAYREYVHLDGPLGIAVEVADEIIGGRLAQLFGQTNYFGKRGSFFQLLDAPALTAELPAGFIPVGRAQTSFAADGLIQVLDDWGPEITFGRLDIYSPERIRLGRERVLHSTVLPYRVAHSSRSFTEYELQFV